ncbi:endonuclease I family protein [Turneriella parva]|uniref:Endonuclease I n=1 Tax=Turneriella parva (strain ATCC BAA-1111 / DSM 21527 / NCTC 11395 / H) TaxID=869212 RepID=I4B9D6_TURPD|nr:endonuclease [Turneriella parva]AFM13893.1 Endonuclease I [Turneriella parva DSM 21527]
MKKYFFAALVLIALGLAACATNTQGDSLEIAKNISDDGCTVVSNDHRGFWIGVNSCQSDTALKTTLHNKIKNHRVIKYQENGIAQPTGYTFTYIGDSISYLNNFSLPVNGRFDMWDAYIAYAIRGINPLRTDCTSRQITDWYNSVCRTVPGTNIAELFASSGGDQDPGSGSNKYNREHSWPKSWYAAGATPVNDSASGSYCYNANNEGANDYPTKNWDYRAYADMVHVIPTNRDANTIRSDNPFGEVSGAGTCGATCNPSLSGAPDVAAITPATPTCLDGDDSRVPCTGLTVFEPPAGIKGDIARIYFYMATRYYLEDTCWQNVAAANKANIKGWQETMLRKWHNDDPVDDVERARNDLIHRIQGNRNPYVDHPEWVAKIADF